MENDEVLDCPPGEALAHFSTAELAHLLLASTNPSACATTCAMDHATETLAVLFQSAKATTEATTAPCASILPLYGRNHDDPMDPLTTTTTSAAFAAADDNASPASSDAATNVKRLRRTEIERLSRRRRQSTLRTTRDEVTALETTFKSLLKSHATRKSSLAATASSAPTTATTTPETNTRFLREGFIDLALETERLERDQSKLKRMLTEKELLWVSLKSLASGHMENWSEESASTPLPSLATAAVYAPLAAEEYFRLMREAYQEMDRHTTTLLKQRATAGGGQCMGWRHHQYAKNDPSSQPLVVSSCLCKSLSSGFSASQVMRDSWELFASESKQQKAFKDWTAGISCHVLCQISDDMVVLYRTFERRHVDKRFHSILLLFRVETDDGFLLGMRTIPTPQVQDALKAPDKWTDVCTWIQFKQQAGSSALDVVYGNAYPMPLPVPLSVLYMNFFTDVVRWEAAVATPRALTWA